MLWTSRKLSPTKFKLQSSGLWQVHHQDGGTKVLQNVDTLLQHYMASQTRKPDLNLNHHEDIQSCINPTLNSTSMYILIWLYLGVHTFKTLSLQFCIHHCHYVPLLQTETHCSKANCTKRHPITQTQNDSLYFMKLTPCWKKRFKQKLP
jgi:hypothetical protein